MVYLKEKGIIWRNPSSGSYRGIVRLLDVPSNFQEISNLDKLKKVHQNYKIRHGHEIDSDLSNQTPEAHDINAPIKVKVSIYRILRDTKRARKVKDLYKYKCQFRLCNETIILPNGNFYAEAHHIKPLGSPHNGPDNESNILCLCPKHHVLLDYGVIEIKVGMLQIHPEHSLKKKFIKYHNKHIYDK